MKQGMTMADDKSAKSEFDDLWQQEKAERNDLEDAMFTDGETFAG